MTDIHADSVALYWKKCSGCKKEIPYHAAYYLCSVSTCRGERTGFVFCSVSCWDSHLGYARHREAYAEEERAPSQAKPHLMDEGPQRRLIRHERATAGSPSVSVHAKDIDTDTLVVTSKVKQLIRDQSGFNTSQCAIDALTQKVVRACLTGIERARSADRKTVMGRDILGS